MQVSQLVCKPFSIVKLFPGVIHRGIANEESFDRVLFFVSTNTEWCVVPHVRTLLSLFVRLAEALGTPTLVAFAGGSACSCVCLRFCVCL